MFPTSLDAIEKRISEIDPIKYGQTRNYKNGAVTRLSPYISRGVISTKQVFEYVVGMQLPWASIEKLVQELAWRDYWQQVWIAKGNQIDQDLKHQQEAVRTHEIPEAIISGKTKIEAIDQGIHELQETGYMHNHMRMYVAALACNVGQCHWLQPAKWMYSHLLDGDWASNALSWQWVAGTNAKKKYYANQENINRFFNSNQKDTFLDVDYETFQSIQIPQALEETVTLDVKTPLPKSESLALIPNKKTLIYNYYNLDPKWYAKEDVQRVLLLEPSFFEQYPVNKKCIDFYLALSKIIPNLKLFEGEFCELTAQISTDFIIFKEHPTNIHYKGTEEPRDWMFDVKGYYPSFFAFWKKCKKQIQT